MLQYCDVTDEELKNSRGGSRNSSAQQNREIVELLGNPGYSMMPG